MKRLFIILLVLLIENVVANNWVNYCVSDLRLSLIQSQMRVTCNRRARKMSGGYCIYSVDNACFIFEGWDNHGSKFCVNEYGGLTE